MILRLVVMQHASTIHALAHVTFHGLPHALAEPPHGAGSWPGRTSNTRRTAVPKYRWVLPLNASLRATSVSLRGATVKKANGIGPSRPRPQPGPPSRSVTTTKRVVRGSFF
jgi:hypothetical protein